jgi:DNA-binding transcriptional LysR family regulator
MEINQFRYFLAVCQHLNFTKAAGHCNVSQPSLTRAIQKLEEELGGPLFRRERARTHMTDLGRLMRPHLEQVMEAREAAKREAEDFHSLKTASLRLGVMCTLGSAYLVSFFDRLHRAIPVAQMQLRDASGVELIDDLMAGELDVAFVGMARYPERMDVLPLYKERYVISFPKGHRFERMNAVPMKEMEGETYLQRANCELATNFEDFAGFSWPYDMTIPYESEREDWIQCMIAAGMGCAFMPETMPVMAGICRRIIVDPEIERTTSLVTVAGRRHSPALRVLKNLVESHNWKSTSLQ